MLAGHSPLLVRVVTSRLGPSRQLHRVSFTNPFTISRSGAQSGPRIGGAQCVFGGSASVPGSALDDLVTRPTPGPPVIAQLSCHSFRNHHCSPQPALLLTR